MCMCLTCWALRSGLVPLEARGKDSPSGVWRYCASPATLATDQSHNPARTSPADVAVSVSAQPFLQQSRFGKSETAPQSNTMTGQYHTNAEAVTLSDAWMVFEQALRQVGNRVIQIWHMLAASSCKLHLYM